MFFNNNKISKSPDKVIVHFLKTFDAIADFGYAKGDYFDIIPKDAMSFTDLGKSLYSYLTNLKESNWSIDSGKKDSKVWLVRYSSDKDHKYIDFNVVTDPCDTRKLAIFIERH